MPELLRVQTAEFEFSVWCSDISRRQQVHQTTLTKRHLSNQSINPNDDHSEDLFDRAAVVRFSPPLEITRWLEIEQPSDLVSDRPTPELALKAPLFFENTQYQFEWVFLADVRDAKLSHRSQTVNGGFRFAEQRGAMPARLLGSINTGNDVGWICLPLEYEMGGQSIRNHIAFEVLPTKMDLHRDLPVMYRAIDQTFPLWRFSLVEKTEQDAAKGMQRGHFPLMWLANFGQLRARFEQGLKVISQAPHSRLQSHVAHNKAAQLRGRIPYKLGAKVKEGLANGQQDRRYRVEKKNLSVDTPENRFIKMVVTRCKRQLSNFEQRLQRSNQAPDQQRFSATFLNEIHNWQHPLKKVLGQSFLTEVGRFSGHSCESLVLQQKTGYSVVYRVWQELKFYLDLFSNQSSLSMKSVAEIYEIWCFLTLKQILQNELGFDELTTSKGKLALNELFEYQLKDGFAGAFEFKRSDGVKARLAHEPKFTKKGATIRSYLVNQEPDIVLEITLPRPSHKRFIWLFDAKYRIKTDTNRFDQDIIDTEDYVPDDAINQMHRYRDALIRITQDKENPGAADAQKSRPVFGAFALYPGFFNQDDSTNPYSDAIHEIGIGAFALLPSTDTSCSGHAWLLDFLKEQIGGNPTQGASYSIDTLAERLYVQEAARIPYYGMEQVLYL